jgi:hypothetical protein
MVAMAGAIEENDLSRRPLRRGLVVAKIERLIPDDPETGSNGDLRTLKRMLVRRHRTRIDLLACGHAGPSKAEIDRIYWIGRPPPA